MAPYGNDVEAFQASLEMAKNRFANALKEQKFIQDKKPMLYIYQGEYKGNIMTGIVACVSAEDYDLGLIKKHENTLEAREKQLGDYLEALKINTTPVLITYPENQIVEQIIKSKTEKKESFGNSSGFRIRGSEANYSLQINGFLKLKFWLIENNSEINELINIFKNISTFYIADGHHRAKVASNVSKKLKGKNPDDESQFFSALLVSDSQLSQSIFPFYRRIIKSENIVLEKAIDRIKTNYDFKKCNLQERFNQIKSLGNKTFILCLNEKECYELKPKKAMNYEGELDNLAVSILQNTILEPAFNIKNPSKDKRIDFASMNISYENFLEILNQDETLAMFLTRAPSIQSILKIADNNQIMPPKSTSFEPKVTSGLILHSIT